MYDNYNYPPGADAPDAPWNQREPEPIEVSCDVAFVLRKAVVVETTNYEMDVDEEDGYTSYELLDGTSDIKELVEQEHNSIFVLLDELAKYIQSELEDSNISHERKCKLKGMLEDCQGWQEEEIDIQEYNRV